MCGLLIALSPSQASSAGPPVRAVAHQLTVDIDPARHHLEGRDSLQVTIQQPLSELSVQLHPGLHIDDLHGRERGQLILVSFTRCPSQPPLPGTSSLLPSLVTLKFGRELLTFEDIM